MAENSAGHWPIIAILGPKTSVPSLATARLQRWAVLFSAYTYDIAFKPTDRHANADGLSRPPLPNDKDPTVKISTRTTSVFNISLIEAQPVTAADIGAATKKDPILAKVYHYTKTAWPAEVKSALKPYQQRQHVSNANSINTHHYIPGHVRPSLGRKSTLILLAHSKARHSWWW